MVQDVNSNMYVFGESSDADENTYPSALKLSSNHEIESASLYNNPSPSITRIKTCAYDEPNSQIFIATENALTVGSVSISDMILEQLQCLANDDFECYI